jgi:hypothetical protein
VRVAFKEIRVGRSRRRGWLVCFDGSVVAVLGQRVDADPDGDVVVEHSTIQPFASLWGTSWSSLVFAKEDFREVARLYARGADEDEMRDWRPVVDAGPEPGFSPG